jgi:hypothetical protein
MKHVSPAREEPVPKTQFTTDELGHLPTDVQLFPLTAYRAVPPDRKAAIRLSEPDDLARWIDSCVLGDLRTLKLGIDAHMSRPGLPLGGGNFLLLAGCLMALEYFAWIYSSEKNAVTSVRSYASAFLVPINPKYHESIEILWRAARNGMLHGSWPQRVSFQGDTKEYKFNVGNELSDAHLTCVNDMINISAPRFLADLEASAHNGFLSWLRGSHDTTVLERGQPRVLEISSSDARGMAGLRAMTSWGE